MFFQHIHQIMTAGVDITLVMRKGDDGSMTVSLLPKSQSLKDSAQNRFIPLTLNGTPAELDAMKTAGIQAHTEKKETEEYIECTVRIPKLTRVQV